MLRDRRVMNDELAKRITKEAHNAGIRQISFYSGGEPFLNKALPTYVSLAKSLGYDYCYLSTNGGKAVTGKILPVLQAGVDSIKFSINAGTKDSYKAVHGRDEFEDVISNLELTANYRAKHRPTMKLYVSFVDTDLSRDTFDDLKSRISHLVDEVVRYPFVVIGTPLRQIPSRPFIDYTRTDRKENWNQQRLRLPCYQLWNYLNVTAEGYLSACCSDYNNDLVVGNLHTSSLLEAWHSKEFQALRQQHIDRSIRGTLCEGCIAQKDRPYKPINMHLRTNEGRSRTQRVDQ